MTRCRSCGARPEDVLRQARVMPRFAEAPTLGLMVRFGTRWRDIHGGARDFICWFCQLWDARLFGLVLRGLA